VEIEDLNMKLFYKKPIELFDSVVIHQPTIKEILNYGFSKFTLLLSPYRADIDMLNIDDENKKLYKNFDLFFFKTQFGERIFKIGNIDMLNLLIDSIKFYFKTDDIIVSDEHMCLVINKVFILDRDNFDYISSLIFKINKTTKPKFEKSPVFQNDRQRDVYEKIMKGREKSQQENSTNYETIMNNVVHGGDYFISYDYVENMSIYQLINTYESIMNKEGFNKNFSQYLAGAEPDKLDLTHWSQKLKIV
jgi:hypothetical protein